MRVRNKRIKATKQLKRWVMESKAPREGGKFQMGDRNCPGGSEKEVVKSKRKA